MITMPSPATPSEPRPDTRPQADPGHPDLVEQAATAMALPFALARRLLPDSPVPVALGGAALLLAGAIDLPVAAAIGLGYVALRHWNISGAAERPTRGGQAEHPTSS